MSTCPNTPTTAKSRCEAGNHVGVSTGEDVKENRRVNLFQNP
uniref:Uncharacterized protein n=1 Tax=Lupinus angustifolius TaxID=3871 RepID=L0P0W6_LUPAN|nr:hypothetical protein [Lupinus angustifolius]